MVVNSLGSTIASVDVTAILQFVLLVLVLVVPILLFAIYKFVSNKRRHIFKMAMLEKGLMDGRNKNKGPKWFRSIYVGVFFGIVSGFFGYVFFREDDLNAALIAAVLLALAGLFLVRGILKRMCWIKTLALDGGIAPEKVFPIKPRRALWVTSFAIGLPLLVYAAFIFRFRPFPTDSYNAIVLGVCGCGGAAFLIRGLLLGWYLWREAKAAHRRPAHSEIAA